MRTKYKLVKILFNTGLEIEFQNAIVTPDFRVIYITTSDGKSLIIPIYNVLYISKEGEIGKE